MVYGTSGSDGTLIIQEANISELDSEVNYPYGQLYYGQAPALIDARGTITLSQLVLQGILYHSGSGAPNPGQSFYPGNNTGGNLWFQTNPAGDVCVSGVAMNVGLSNSTVQGGQVYLYLNNTQQGYILNF